jgi:hypothetical protein
MKETRLLWILGASGVLACSAGDTSGRRPSATAGSAGTGTGTGGAPGTISGQGGAAGTIGGGVGTTPGTNFGMPANCSAGEHTTITGRVYDPAGKVPLYNAVVYLPSRDLDPIAEGVSCDKCDGTASGGPVAAALTDANGQFTLTDTPAGDNIPLVIQIGKWRRLSTIPKVAPCTETAISDREITRLPRNQSEGHLPQMAVTTGHSDAIECLLRKIGIADSEFTLDSGAGRVHMYVGCDAASSPPPKIGANAFSAALGGGTFAPASSLWGDMAKLAKYDILLFSCEGSQCADQKKPYLPNIKAYADQGGKLFLDHLHFYWLNHNADSWQSSADYPGAGGDLPNPFSVKVDTTFFKGNAFADWLLAVGASATRGTLSILGAQFSVRATTAPMTQQWIFTDQNPLDSSMKAVEYMTMNTPVELSASNPGGQCGRVVLTDLHVSSASGETSHAETAPFPGGCKQADLTPQEKALEFMFFDLSSCVQPESMKPMPPPVIR